MADVKMLLLDYRAAQNEVVRAEEKLEVAKANLFEGIIQERMLKYIDLRTYKIDQLTLQEIEAGEY
jgi:hypothetical protein